MTPIIESTSRAGLTAEVRDIQADGTLGEMLRSGSLGTKLRDRIRSSVQSVLGKATNFHGTLPPILQELVRLRSASFAEAADGRLLLNLNTLAVISNAQFQDLRGRLGRQ